MNMISRAVRPEEYAQLAEMMANCNVLAETQCIHSGEGAAAILSQIEAYALINEIVLAVAEKEGRIVAVIGCEYSLSSQRGWLWGPFVVDEAWEAATSALATLYTLLPSEIGRVDSFLNQMNQAGHTFYLRQGYVLADVIHVYLLTRPETMTFVPTCPELSEATIPTFMPLHNSLFPDSQTGQSIVDELDAFHRVFVMGDAQQVWGYVYVSVDVHAPEGYIEFLGVHPDKRREGLGRLLLETAVHWLFTTHNLPQISLTVVDDRDPARRLYESVGFGRQYTGLNTRQTAF